MFSFLDHESRWEFETGTDNQENDEKQSQKRQNWTRNGKDCERQSQIKAGKSIKSTRDLVYCDISPGSE
ncbi:hypothetical protein Tco_0306444, partial [Tanacetum coccineum]